MAVGPSRVSLGQGPVCDRCGRVEPDRYRFCPDCELFVCAECWDPENGVCLTSSRPNLPAPGLLPISIRNTIGERSAGVPLSASRVGQALVGPAPSPARAAAATPSAVAAKRPPRRMARGILAFVAVVVLVTLAFVALPALAQLLGTNGASPAPRAASTASGSSRSVAPAGTAARKYVVRPGDTLRSIAARLYGDEARWSDIYRANRQRVRNPDSLDVGTTLAVP